MPLLPQNPGCLIVSGVKVWMAHFLSKNQKWSIYLSLCVDFFLFSSKILHFVVYITSCIDPQKMSCMRSFFLSFSSTNWGVMAYEFSYIYIYILIICSNLCSSICFKNPYFILTYNFNNMTTLISGWLRSFF